jgi:hypothetical protein
MNLSEQIITETITGANVASGNAQQDTIAQALAGNRKKDDDAALERRLVEAEREQERWHRAVGMGLRITKTPTGYIFDA